VPLAPDHQVVVDGDAERLGRLPDLLGHLDVGSPEGWLCGLLFEMQTGRDHWENNQPDEFWCRRLGQVRRAPT
jgi:hypothetical protein